MQCDTNLAGLTGKKVLIVEEEVLVAIDLEQILTQMGAEVVARAGTLKAGLLLAQELDLDFATLTIRLSATENSIPIRDALTIRGIKFMYLTAYDEQHAVTVVSPGDVIAYKPYTVQSLLAAIRCALQK